MMITFSALEGEDAHARRAIRCSLAIAMIAYQTRFWIRQAFPEQGLDKFGVGIGIHSGELIFAEFGLPPARARGGERTCGFHCFSVAVKSKEMDWNVVCSEQALDAAGQGVQTRRRRHDRGGVAETSGERGGSGGGSRRRGRGGRGNRFRQRCWIPRWNWNGVRVPGVIRCASPKSAQLPRKASWEDFPADTGLSLRATDR